MILHLLLIWLLSAIALVITAYLLPSVELADFGTAMKAAALIGLFNVLFGWIFHLIFFPIYWLLPGLVSLFVDAVMIWLVSRLSRGFYVRGFGSALLAALVLAVVNLLLGAIL